MREIEGFRERESVREGGSREWQRLRETGTKRMEKGRN